MRSTYTEKRKAGDDPGSAPAYLLQSSECMKYNCLFYMTLIGLQRKKIDLPTKRMYNFYDSFVRNNVKKKKPL